MAEHTLTTRIEVAGAEEARRTLMDFYEAFKTGKEDVKSLNKEMREVTAPIIWHEARALRSVQNGECNTRLGSKALASCAILGE